jgi:hypothetical protein
MGEVQAELMKLLKDPTIAQEIREALYAEPSQGDAGRAHQGDAGECVDSGSSLRHRARSQASSANAAVPVEGGPDDVSSEDDPWDPIVVLSEADITEIKRKVEAEVAEQPLSAGEKAKIKREVEAQVYAEVYAEVFAEEQRKLEKSWRWKWKERGMNRTAERAAMAKKGFKLTTQMFGMYGIANLSVKNATIFERLKLWWEKPGKTRSFGLTCGVGLVVPAILGTAAWWFWMLGRQALTYPPTWNIMLTFFMMWAGPCMAAGSGLLAAAAIVLIVMGLRGEDDDVSRWLPTELSKPLFYTQMERWH